MSEGDCQFKNEGCQPGGEGGEARVEVFQPGMEKQLSTSIVRRLAVVSLEEKRTSSSTPTPSYNEGQVDEKPYRFAADTGGRLRLGSAMNLRMKYCEQGVHQGCQPVQGSVMTDNEVDGVSQELEPEYDLGLVTTSSGSGHDQNPPRGCVEPMRATSQGCQPEAEDKKQPSPATDSTRYRKQKPKAIKKKYPPQSLKAIIRKDGRQLGVHVDPIRKNIIVSLPPCIAGTELGKTLAARMMAEDWHMHTVESVGSQLLTPTPPYDMIRHERTLGLRSPADTNCGHCKAPDARYKCEGCWTRYYCCQGCQRGDWTKGVAYPSRV